jgi:GT2 family glycosyltransferase/Tfp pilus assembly protein PilF
MTRKYLFGPVTRDFAEQNLAPARQSGDCLAFNDTDDLELSIRATDNWDQVTAALPSGWQPDFIVLYLPYTTVPACLWSAPVPVVALAADWPLLWHHYRRCLRGVDLILTDTKGVETLAQEGIPHVLPANLFGLERSFLEYAWPDAPRDIDILFCGNLHQAVQRERLPWIARLAGLADRWHVEIHQGIFGDDYRALLGRARIVFNRSIRGECNKRVFEAAAAGALLFQEAENREVGLYVHERRHCVYYRSEDLDLLLEHYLNHEEERRALVEAARTCVPQFSFEHLWQGHLKLIEREWPTLLERATHRQAKNEKEDLTARVQQALGSLGVAEPSLLQELALAASTQQAGASVHNALGMLTALSQRQSAALAEEAAGYFTRALACDPAHIMAGLNRAEALAACGHHDETIEQAHRTLAVLDRRPGLSPQNLDAGHFPVAFDTFRVEWERAAWSHAGRPAAEAEAKRHLLRWRLHSLLADLTGDLGHAYEASLARPDLPVTRAQLGAALLRANRPADAAEHLRCAVEASPFDLQAARLLAHALQGAGDAEGLRRLARHRRGLARAAPRLVPQEPWFMDAPPVGDELASILILCCNQVEYTRLCLESILRHTRQPYELILVDNGSTDDTALYLNEIRSQPGPVRVDIIRNETNRGFAAGCNQALAAARGHYLVFLNNDTVVPSGWLDGLIGWSLHDWPRVGLVGPVSGYAPPPQHVQPDYTEVDGLNDFAARRAVAFAGQALPIERLTGFCLLVRREVFDKIGAFDESYELGFFEDDDLCVRAREAGFALLVAQDVFIHHFGSRTFAGLGLDYHEHLTRNFEHFKAKWGPERAAGYQLLVDKVGGPSSVVRSEEVTAPGASELRTTDHGLQERGAGCQPAAGNGRSGNLPHQRVSLCMIAKNEEHNLPACIGSVKDLVDEIIVVDTGSSDRTREVAAELAARVFDFPWVDSFAAARNQSLRHATGDWVLWLDADDRVDQENQGKLRELFAGLRDENTAYVLKCLCEPDPISGSATVVDHVRVFRHDPELRWRYRVHEQILPALRQRGYEVRWADVTIRHTGYQDRDLRRRKLDRDLKLLLLENAEHPHDPFTLFNLGSVYLELGKTSQSLPMLQRSLQRSHSQDSIVRKLYSLLISAHRQLRQFEQALDACRAGRQLYPEDAELLFQEGLLLREQGQREAAEACFRRLLSRREGEHFGSVDAGLQGYKARHNLAVLYQEQKRWPEAEAQWRLALAEQPDFGQAWLGLAEILLGQGRWPELEDAAQHLGNGARLPMEAAVVRARGHLARREFAAARQELEAAIARDPQALWPRVILTHVLLQEGRDWDAAERALRDVLVLDPHHAEAQRNLEVLLRQQGKGAGLGAEPTVVGGTP